MTAVELSLRLVGFRRSARLLDGLARVLPFAHEPGYDEALVQQVADIVDRAAGTTSVYPAQCLPRSLTLHYFLKRYGQPAALKLGVQTITGEFSSHAWVECGGRELNEVLPANELYQPIDWQASARAERHG